MNNGFSVPPWCMNGIISLNFKTNLGQRVNPTLLRTCLKQRFYQSITNRRHTIPFLMKTNPTSRRNQLLVRKVSMKEQDILEAYITCHISPPLLLSYKLISPSIYLQKLTFLAWQKRMPHSKPSSVQKSRESFKELQCHSYHGIVNP